MKRLKKIIIWVIAIVMSIVVIGVAGIIIFFPKEKIKEMAVERISSILDRQVTIDGISVSFLGGLGAYLEGIKISNPEGFREAYFLDAKALDVKLQLLPLLKKQVAVDRLILVEPEIALRRLDNGKVNYRFGAIDSLAPPAVKERLPAESKLAVSAISFDNLVIKEGRLDFVDDSLDIRFSAVDISLESKLETPQEFVFHAFGDIAIDSLLISSDTIDFPPFSVKASYDARYDIMQDSLILSKSSISINENKFNIEGTIPDLATLSYADFQIESGHIDIENVLALLPQEYKTSLQAYNIGGELTLNAAVKYDNTTKDTLQYKGKVNFSTIRLSSMDFPGQLLINSAQADFENDFVNLNIQNASFENNRFEASIGVGNFDNPIVDGKLTGSIDLASLNSYLPEADTSDISGTISFRMNFKGPVKTLSRMRLTGTVAVENATYSSTTLPEPIQSANLAMRIESRDIIVEKFDVKFQSSTITMKGKVSNALPYLVSKLDSSIQASSTGELNLDGEVSGSIDMAFLTPYLPQECNPKVSGDMAFDIKFNGPPEKPSKMQLSGKVSIAKAAYDDATLPEPVESLNLDMKIDNRDIVINKLNVQFSSSDFALTGKLSDALPYFIPGYSEKARKPYLSFELTSNRFDVDKLFPEVAPGEGTNPAQLPADSIPSFILPDINGDGSGTIDTLIYTQIEFTNIRSDININNRKILIDNVVGNVYTGSITGETEIDLNDFENPRYSGKFNATQIEVNDFMTRFTGFGGHLYSKVDMSGSFSASGWESDSIISSLSMEGRAVFDEGRLVNFDLIKKLADNLNFKTFEEETLRDGHTSFRVADGRVEFDTLKFFSGMGDWDVTGSVGFDGSLDYRGQVLLTEKVSNDLLSKYGLVSGLAGLFKESKSDRVNVPFKLTGTYSKPKISIDFSAGEKLKQEAKEKLGDALKKLFKKK